MSDYSILDFIFRIYTAMMDVAHQIMKIMSFTIDDIDESYFGQGWEDIKWSVIWPAFGNLTLFEVCFTSSLILILLWKAFCFITDAVT